MAATPTSKPDTKPSENAVTPAATAPAPIHPSLLERNAARPRKAK